MSPTAPKAAATADVAVIHPANLIRTTIRIRGTAPYIQEKFSKKVADKLMADMATPAAAKKGKSARPPRNYDEDYEGAQHKTVGGWVGMPCSGFRAAMIAACRTVNLVMTRAKLAVFVLPDGFDAQDGSPLVRIYGSPERTALPVRNDNGSVDIRIRPMWREWYADVTVEFDADMITPESVVNLLDRAGRQVGVGAGRPFSKNSVGQGWGTFTVDTQQQQEKTA